MSRDPRFDPRPGDVIHKLGHFRQRVELREGDEVLISDNSGMQLITVDIWTRYARNATVIHAAPEVKP